MRQPEEMYEMIVEVARRDENIRGVIMTGSRANPDCPKDSYQDFDIIYMVKDMKPYWDNMEWVCEKFGKPALMQKPESMKLIAPDGDGSFVYLMLFPDGNRIDLKLTTEVYRGDGEPAVVLLDKDAVLTGVQVEKGFWYVRKPDQKLFSDCCNEFHWCLNNVAKGIARQELSYAMKQLNEYVRDMLVQMLEWYVGVEHNFEISAGKNGKYFKNLLPEELYKRFEQTYTDASYEHMWEAAFEMLSLFGDVARSVGKSLSFVYDEEEEAGIEQYMRQVRKAWKEES